MISLKVVLESLKVAAFITLIALGVSAPVVAEDLTNPETCFECHDDTDRDPPSDPNRPQIHKPTGGVFQEDDRNIVQVAEADKPGVLVGRIDIDLPGRYRRVVGNEANDIATHTTQGSHGVARTVWLNFQEVAVITQLLDHDGDIDRCIESCGRVKSLLQQYIDIPGLAT